jgi:hypothetical protein
VTAHDGDDFRSTADSIAHAASTLAEIEERKAELEPSDPEARRLTAEAEDAAEDLQRDVRVERAIVTEAGSKHRPD